MSAKPSRHKTMREWTIDHIGRHAAANEVHHVIVLMVDLSTGASHDRPAPGNTATSAIDG